MGINIFLHFLHTAAIRMNADFREGRTWQRTGLFIEKWQFIKYGQELDDSIKPLFLGCQRIEKGINFQDGGHRKTKTFLSFLKHITNRIELILIDKTFEEKIGRELNRYFTDLFWMTIMLFPYMFQILSGNQNQIIITDHFCRITDDPSHTGCFLRKVQLKFGMIVNGISKLRFIPFGNVETILIGQRSDLPNNIAL